MDIFAHGIYNIALQKTLRKDKQKWKKILEAFWWGIMPDLLAFGAPLLVAIFLGSLDHHALVNGTDLSALVYPFTHSLVIFGAVFLILSLLLKKWYLPMLGWGFHILMDIPFHTPNFFPTPFLFPVSSYTLPFGIYWGTPAVWIGLWAIVIIWLLILIYRSKYYEQN